MPDYNPYITGFIELKDKGTRGRIFVREQGSGIIDMILAVPKELHLINVLEQPKDMIVKVIGKAGGKELTVVIEDTLEELAAKINALHFGRGCLQVGGSGVGEARDSETTTSARSSSPADRESVPLETAS